MFIAVRTGLEPATPGVTGPYSNQLNYRTSMSIFLVSTGVLKSRVNRGPEVVFINRFPDCGCKDTQNFFTSKLFFTFFALRARCRCR